MEVARFLDGLRKRYRFALLMEDHAPQATGGRRDLRPVGSGVWMRWPDIGLSLTPDQGNTKLVLHRFRGDRMENDWPDEVVRGGKGGTWPWVGYWEHGHNDQESF
jgi:replicative DNA helicase